MITGRLSTPEAKFELGRIYQTASLARMAAESGEFARGLGEVLQRHVSGDWGDLDDEDKAENEFSLDKYLWLLSAYTVCGVKVWVITEADRASTTILKPEEY